MNHHLELARRIAKEAAELTLRYFYAEKSVDVERKDDDSPVTIADREAELLLRKRIEEAFPDDAICGEEFGIREGSSGFRWFLDPIDGTKSFIHGVPIYSTLIGIEQNNVSVAGVIAIPALQEFVWAGKGLGAWHETPRYDKPRPARVSACQTLSEALFLTSEVKSFDEAKRGEAYKLLEQKCRLSRTWGDAYGYAMVATGRADVMADPIMSDWDAGPLLVILEEAGGCFTDWKGTPTIYGKEGVATNRHLHKEVIEILKRFS